MMIIFLISRFLHFFRSVGDDKLHWFPYGCPPLAPLVNITLKCEDNEAKKTAISIIKLFKEGMNDNSKEKQHTNTTTKDADDDEEDEDFEIDITNK
jgi:hypothetical protein